jgi:hypothetical protein
MEASTDGKWPWWLRYLVAIGLIVLAVYSSSSNEKDSGILALVMIVIAFFMMHEILVILILGGIAYLIFGAIAALPTSVAIIIGALILADKK